MKSLKKMLIILVFVSIFQIYNSDSINQSSLELQTNEEVWPKG